MATFGTASHEIITANKTASAVRLTRTEVSSKRPRRRRSGRKSSQLVTAEQIRSRPVSQHEKG